MFGHPCDGISGGIIPILFCFRSNERETLWVLFIDFILVESQRTGAACHTRKVTWLLLLRTTPIVIIDKVKVVKTNRIVNFIFIAITRNVTRSFHVPAAGHKHEIASHGEFCTAARCLYDESCDSGDWRQKMRWKEQMRIPAMIEA